ncbi:hypothetical protein [Spirillospora sp. NPDC047279]|uniref:hypothetical protein n=1 Tax=Spirillospora sp. NPDC047279 TaxID=3155478 RepID=UPI00340ADBD9
MNTTDIIVSIAQVAAGGTIVQAMVAVFRRRGELRQLERQNESVAVDTADQLVGMLRRELVESKQELADVKQDRENLQRQVGSLSEHVSKVSADLAVARADISRMRDTAS